MHIFLGSLRAKCITTKAIANIFSAWTAWNAWSACSQTCGQGVRTRDRSCVDTTGHVTLGCAGQNINTQACNDQTCLGRHI